MMHKLGCSSGHRDWLERTRVPSRAHLSHLLLLSPADTAALGTGTHAPHALRTGASHRAGCPSPQLPAAAQPWPSQPGAPKAR